MNSKTMYRTLLALLVLSTTQALAAPPDGWHYLTPDGGLQKSPIFSEFKYFNFQSKDITGAITYSVFAPSVTKSLQLNAYFYTDGRVFTVHRTYPLNCVAAQPDKLVAHFCGNDSVEVVSSDSKLMKIHVVQSTGPIEWDLTFIAPTEEVTDEVSVMPLGHKSRFGPLLDIQEMNWSPVMRSGFVEGTVAIPEAGKKFAVRTTTIYHDENWENWIPQLQPFNWLHFTALDSAKERVDLLMVEFPKGTTATAGLTMYSKGVKKFWAPGRYKLTVIKNGYIPVTRRFGANADQLDRQIVDPEFRRSETANRSVPIEYLITTDDDQVTARFKVVAAISSSTGNAKVEGSKALAPILERVLVEEQVMDVRLRFLSHAGVARTAKGRGEFMNTANEP